MKRFQFLSGDKGTGVFECADGGLVRHEDHVAEMKIAEIRLRTAEARANRLACILTGATREETAENIFAVSKGVMNTRSVHILADELWSERAQKV